MKVFLILAIAAVGLPGCVTRGGGENSLAVISAENNHSSYCRQDEEGDCFIHVENHRHGDRCGHSFVQGAWIVRR